jgi:hypothetical protein
VRRFVDGFSAALVSKTRPEGGNLYYDTEDIEPHYKQLYLTPT